MIPLVWALGCSSSQKPPFSGEKIREYAAALYNRQLYPQAIEQYRYYLENYPVDIREQANVTYTIANIYFERLHDYENALAYYLKIKHLYPESPLQKEVNKRIVACLERLQRSEDAQQALEEATSLTAPKRTKQPGQIIAKIGDREITQGDLDFELNRLPPEIRSQYRTKEQKVDFLRRYIATELLYDSAKRKGLDNDKDVIEATFQAKKGFMVQKLLQEEIDQKIDIKPEDVELYYKANREKYAEKDEKGNITRIPPLKEIRAKVFQDLYQERRDRAMRELMDRLLRANNVVIYDDLIQ